MVGIAQSRARSARSFTSRATIAVVSSFPDAAVDGSAVQMLAQRTVAQLGEHGLRRVDQHQQPFALEAACVGRAAARR
jgi:hypothetical protein